MAYDTPIKYTGKLLRVTELATNYGLKDRKRLKEVIGDIDTSKYPGLYHFFRKRSLHVMTNRLVDEVIDIIGDWRE